MTYFGLVCSSLPLECAFKPMKRRQWNVHKNGGRDLVGFIFLYLYTSLLIIVWKESVLLCMLVNIDVFCIHRPTCGFAYVGKYSCLNVCEARLTPWGWTHAQRLRRSNTRLGWVVLIKLDRATGAINTPSPFHPITTWSAHCPASYAHFYAIIEGKVSSLQREKPQRQ